MIPGLLYLLAIIVLGVAAALNRSLPLVAFDLALAAFAWPVLVAAFG